MNFSKLGAALLLASTTCFSVAAAEEVETAKGYNAEAPEIIVMLPGVHNDNGFMEAGYRGYKRITEEVTDNAKCVYNISAKSDKGALKEALARLAAENPQVIIAHGGQCNAPVSEVSRAYPKTKFIVIQGNVKTDNVCSYKVDQVASAYLAGALAGYMTKTNKVGHISGAWPKSGLMARAAFYDGLMQVKPKAQFYTHFTGDLDDNEINAAAAKGEIKAGVDVIFTMLNGGRFGVNDVIANTKGKVTEIGNVIDWTDVSDIFVGSAVADSSEAIISAAKAYKNNKLLANSITVIGLNNPGVVRLTLGKQVPKDVFKKLIALRKDVLAGKIKINTNYFGQEFNPATQQFVDQNAKNKQ